MLRFFIQINAFSAGRAIDRRRRKAMQEQARTIVAAIGANFAVVGSIDP
jgi:hypothetical protein